MCFKVSVKYINWLYCTTISQWICACRYVYKCLYVRETEVEKGGEKGGYDK